VLFGAVTTVTLAVTQFVFTPVCVWLLGPEKFGIVAFGTTLLLTLVFLNQSISPVVVRELGRARSEPAVSRDCSELIKALETLSIVLGFLVGTLIAFSAPLLVKYGLKASTMSEDQVLLAVRLIGLMTACQWPAFFYRSGFIGLGRQDIFAFISVPFAFLQLGGAFLILWIVSPSLTLFFAWQILTFVIYCLVLRFLFWRKMTTGEVESIKFKISRLATVWQFGLGTLIIGCTASLLTQSDKLVVSAYAPLEQFAVYSLASMLAVQFTLVIVSPISVALLPHFAKLFESGDQFEIAREYHRWTQITLTLALPILGVMFAFGKPLLELWLGQSSQLIAPMLQFLPWLAFGTMFNVAVTIPYIAQMAAGWTRLMATFNCVAFSLMLLCLLIGVPRFGAIAAALCWLGLNVSYYVIMVPFMHDKLLPAEKWNWWLRDTAPPVIATVLIFILSQAIAPSNESMLLGILHAGATAVVAWAVLFAIMPLARAEAAALVRLRRVHPGQTKGQN
jgi:O-antigen/teichoic acid export membrane protein